MLAAGFIAAAAMLITACVPPPQGAAPLRYRDPVFTAVSKTADIPYGSALSQAGAPVTLTLDLYQPDGDTAIRRPAIVWVHGGGFSGGDKTSPEIVDQANVFAQKGYLNVSINYRLAPGGCSAGAPTVQCVIGIIDAQHDAQAAVRWLRANAATYRVDPNRIAIGGSSAGAITALNVAYKPTDVGTSGNPGFSSAVQGAQSISGASIPFTAATPGAPPAILFHGTSDFVVPYSWAQQTASAAISQGDFALLQTFQGAGHVPYVQFRSQILDQTANTFYLALDLTHAVQ